jgi:hypothetical protein
MGLFEAIYQHLQSEALGKALSDKISPVLPTTLTPEEKTSITSAVSDVARQYEMELLEITRKQDNEVAEQIKELEGIERDLQGGSWLGSVLRLLRGSQRLVWGYAVLVIDFMVFSGSWSLADKTKQLGAEASTIVGQPIISAFWVINLLVLAVLFGERAVMNLLPIIRGAGSGEVVKPKA